MLMPLFMYLFIYLLVTCLYDLSISSSFVDSSSLAVRPYVVHGSKNEELTYIFVVYTDQINTTSKIIVSSVIPNCRVLGAIDLYRL